MTENTEQLIKDLKNTSLKHFSVPTDHTPDTGKYRVFHIDRTEIPVRELIQFIFVFILEFPIYRPEEKLRWEVPFIYKKFYCTFAMQKFGLRLYIQEGSDKRLASEIIKKIQKAINKTERTFLNDFAKHQIEKGNFTIENRYHFFEERYTYFRKEANMVLKRTETEYKEGTKLTDFFNKTTRAKKELSYNTIAMLDAYFSYLEHFFVLAMPLHKKKNKQLIEFIGSTWSDKYKSVFDIKSDSEAKVFYDKFNNLREQFRNFHAHGGFEKNGASLFIHIPNIGAISAQLSKFKNSPNFDFFPIQESSFSDICQIIDNFDEWVHSKKSCLKKILRYIESGLDITCDDQSLQEIWIAMKTDNELESLIEQESEDWARHANMDY